MSSDGRRGERSSPNRNDVLLAFALAVVASGWCWLGATRTLELRDEGYILQRAESVVRGALPHRDFEALYGPGVYFATGAALALAHREIRGVRVMLAVMRGAAVGVAYAIACSLAPRSLALLAALLATVWWGRPIWLLNAPYAALYTVPLALGALALAIRGSRRRSAGWLGVAGALAGSAVLFKQSLGAMLLGGMGLGLLATALLRGPGGPRRSPGAALPWLVLGGLAPIALTADYLTIGSYLGYFLPLHLLLVGVALRIRERGGSPPLRDVVARVGPFAVGAAVPLALVLIGYAFAGGLGDLLHGMFVLPGSLLGYAQPVHVPPVSRLWLLLALFGPSFAVGLFLRHHRAAAALAAIITGAALAVCAFAPPWSGLPDHALRRAGMAFAEIWSPALGAIGVITWWRVKPADDDPALLVLFFHLLLCFQFFPRAGVNVWLVLGATAPLLAWLGALARRRMLPEADTLGARVAVLAALAFPLVWIGLEPARHVIADPAGPGFVAVDLPSARGLAIPTGQAGRLPLVGLRDTVAHLLRVTAPDAPILVVGNEILPLYLADRPALAPDLQLRVFLLAWGMLEGTGGIDEDGLIDALHADPRARVLEMDGPSSERVRTALPGLARALDAFDEEARYGPFRVLRAPSPAT